MLCNYGCYQEAKYQFRNGKFCCSKYYQQCPAVKKSAWNKGLTKNTSKSLLNSGKRISYLFNEYPERFLERNKKISIKLKGRVPWNKGLKTGKQSKQLIEKRTRNSKNKRSMLNYYKNRYPLLFKINEIIEDENKNLLAKCKTCRNFFITDRSQIHERIRALEHQYGIEENNFYCSEECKTSCSVYRKRGIIIKSELPYTSEEIQTWKSKVKELDNNQCQMCGTTENIHVHHIIPVKLEPFFALDPINGICLCEECHYKIGHKFGTECSTGGLASKIC